MTVELILYATPTGPLADACSRYFAEATALGGTVAQSYPPHCTLTGFFRRSPARASRIALEIQLELDALGAVPDGAVEVLGLRADDGWIGLELRSDWLRGAAERIATRQRIEPGEDALRRKDWLHVSLAYGTDDLDPYRALASTFDATAPASWELGLWLRDANEWQRLATTVGAW